MHTPSVPFHVLEVPLEGARLIDASAGTGKTYSLAILALRLMIEKGLMPRQILMVTFTNAAVAELEKRVRTFVKKAADAVAKTRSSGDGTIDELLARARQTQDELQLQRRAQNALAQLDELAVYTIDSFSKRMLDMFSFETGQLFKSELSSDAESFVESAFYDAWRAIVSRIPPSVLQQVKLDDLIRYDSFKKRLLYLREGKKYLSIPETENLSPEDQFAYWQQRLGEVHERKAAIKQQFGALYQSQRSTLLAETAQNKQTQRWAAAASNEASAFEALINASDNKPQYFGKMPVFSQLWDMAAECKNEDATVFASLQAALYHLILSRALPYMNRQLRQQNIQLFSDLITQLHQVLITGPAGPAAALKQQIAQRYEAVFIDEFQDTSREQFEVFHHLFGAHKVLFYIGDPKQSIYGFRRADINTYFSAASSVKARYTMGHNHRSTQATVQAINAFLQPHPGFDTFGFAQAVQKIQYEAVLAGRNSQGQLIAPQGMPEKGLSWVERKPVAALLQSAAARIFQLLHEPYELELPQGQRRRLCPSDIGILVRSKENGKRIQQMLVQLGIPTVMVNDARVLASPEAAYVTYLLQAMLSPTIASIRKALLGGLTQLNSQDLLRLPEDELYTAFVGFQQILRDEKQGIYTAISAFIHRFQLLNLHLNGPVKNERTITNLYQLAELLHKTAKRRQLSPEELVAWLQRLRADDGDDGSADFEDEYIQRIENDADAVRITTIHASKGLEYNVVFCLGLDMTPPHETLITWHRPGGEYFFAEKARMNQEDLQWAAQQQHQESLRLLYVAITRAVYKCFVYKRADAKEASKLTPFKEAFTPETEAHIAIEPTDYALPPQARYQPPQRPARPLPMPPWPQPEPLWRYYSYSSLKRKEALPFVPAAEQVQDPYDAFVFVHMPRGAEAGTQFHSLMERIDFTQEQYWDYALRTWPAAQQPWYRTLVRHLLNHPIALPQGNSVQLSTVSQAHRLTELQFHLPMAGRQIGALQALSTPDYSMQIQPQLSHAQLHGMLEGVVDLFFEHQGRYYILDWKTDFLGPTPAQYSAPHIAEAMSQRNYHLQSLIYTVAMHRYLGLRLPGYQYATHFGGAIYVFVRGVRPQQPYGVFTRCIDEATVLAAEKILARDLVNTP